MDQLHCLKIFRRAAEAKSFSSIAHEFGLTQPMVSKRIAWLEAELGVTLLRRSTRGIQLTPEGEKLYRAGGIAIDELEAVLSSVKNEKLQLIGHLRITASLAFARLMLGPLLAEFSELHPDLRLHFQLSDGYMDMVENNIDIAFRIGSLPDSTLKAIKIGQSHRKLYASTTYLKKYGTPKSISDLEKHRCLFYTRLSDIPAWPLIDDKKKSKIFSFEAHMQSDASDLIRESLIHGLGIALLPTWMIEDYQDTKNVRSLLEKYSPLPSPIYAVTSNTRGLTAKQRVVIDYFKKLFDSISSISLRT